MGNGDALPTLQDFDPWEGNLDARDAWQNFGGLDLEAAWAKFCDCPEHYQEDFMFMGDKAFAYYFSVIDRYLRASPAENTDGDRQAWILAHCIKAHFEPADLRYVGSLVQPVIELADFVRCNISRFGADDDERRGVRKAWDELAAHMASLRKQR